MIDSRSRHSPFFFDPKIKHLFPDPFLLPNIKKGIERTVCAIKNKEKIAIFGDYDVDGSASAALLYRFFSRYGLDIELYIPDRIEEGYGPNKKALEYLKDRLIFMVDCGTNSPEILDSYDIIILDHHLPEGEIPGVCAVINPYLKEGLNQNLYDLCACGVSFLFLVALTKSLGINSSELLEDLDLVALATICDVMPLTGVNRSFVKQGLKVIANSKKIGIVKLCVISGLEPPFNTDHIGYQLGPRLNAGGRIGESTLSARLLSTDDPKVAESLSQKLDLLNAKRKYIEGIAFNEAKELVEQKGLHKNNVILVSHSDWHPGIIGILAGRLKEVYQKPCFVIAKQTGQGSARSVQGTSVGDLIHKAVKKNYVIYGGGHANAGGFKVDLNRMDDLYTFLENEISKLPQVEYIVPIDIQLPLSALTKSFLKEIEVLEPFGQANPEPKVMIERVKILNSRIVGEHHISCIIKDCFGHEIRAISFFASRYQLDQVLLDADITRWYDVLGSIKQGPQFFIEDIRKSTQSVA